MRKTKQRSINKMRVSDIEQERQDALKNVQSDVADISIAIATKIIKKQLDPEGQQALINSYIEGLGKHES
ncbi:ATP synthase subunit [Lactiplantibacillus plantarum subsp. plantarum]|uniref:ATP synthase subunit n=1 Tax=Lactiplantibacillus plantarum subsp. plantarum TaxID=337330 RepID=A0A2S3U7T6_LACPN|nr:ATP synthase subunit [Lactiplantibacillus plantarum subsp. plantarum]